MVSSDEHLALAIVYKSTDEDEVHTSSIPKDKDFAALHKPQPIDIPIQE